MRLQSYVNTIFSYLGWAARQDLELPMQRTRTMGMGVLGDGAVRSAEVTVLYDVRAERSRFGGTARSIFPDLQGIYGDGQSASIHTEFSAR